ncbi:MAG: TAXI family TRAP transporter solute-binding subunit [Desulfobacterales bacterium]
MSTMSRFTTFTFCFALIAALCLAVAGTGEAKTRLAFSGGPDGGTFQYFSNAISTRISKNIAELEVSNMASAGSVENLRRVNSGDADFGIVYSADLYLGLNGKLTNDSRKYDKIYSMAYLYGAPAHLVVLEGSGIQKAKDLVGKRIAVGPAGSGAAASAQRYLTSLGIWDQVKVEYIGYSQAAAAIGDKLIDAMWVLAGFPNSSVIQAAASNKIAMLNLVEEGKEAGFFKEFPFYTEVVIPKGTYAGVDYDVQVFQDATVWVSGRHVKPEIVHSVLKDVYSPEGLAYMVSVTTAASAMNAKDGLLGIVTPVHKGAIQFWTEAGLSLTPEQKGE